MKNTYYLEKDERIKQIKKEFEYAKILENVQNVWLYKDWYFERSCKYWIATTKYCGIPLELAVELNEKKYPKEFYDECDIEKYGVVVRVNGYSGGISPLENGGKEKIIKTYHIDTQEGLNEFIKTINKL